jgi:hypothetical protein
MSNAPPKNVIRPRKLPTNPSVAGKVIGHYGIELRINETFFPVTPSILTGLRISSNIHTIVPTLQFTSSDLMSVLTNQVDGVSEEGEKTIGGGAKIQIGLSDGSFDPELVNFRVMSIPNIGPAPRYANISIVAHLDAMKWWRGICRGAFKGTSNDVIKRLASECDLGYYGPHPFGDAMTWMPSNQNYSNFANKIAKHAWSDDSSCPMLALDTDMIVRFVDLNRVASEKPVATAKYLKPLESLTDFEVIHCSIRAPSGIANMTGGFKGTAVEETLKGEIIEHSDAQAVRQGQYLEIPQSIAADVGEVRSKMVGLNAGNIHKNYNRAEYQNYRLSSTYAIHADIYTHTVTNLGLLETIDLDVADQTDGSDQRNYSGTYFVSAKTIGINGGRYFEKLRLTTNSRGLSPARDMK